GGPTGNMGGSSTGVGVGSASDIVSADMSIHFLELGNKKTGDCTLIKVGNTEVLIDAGANNTSANTIVPYIRQYCTDGILEYVIATHAHEDHIGAFYSTSSRKGVFESFDCITIIDFPLVSKDKQDKNSATNTNTVYGKYCAARDAEVAAGADKDAAHYTALECWNEEGKAQRTYQLSETVSFSILYQKYYEEQDSSKTAENNYSVCTLFRNGSDSFLFTGDLEEEGESSLVDNNDLPHCKLYKAGHHGSKTSSHDKMLKKISPEIVCVCCCAGSPEYTTVNNNTFPTQDFIDRVGQYTKEIYVTTLATNVNNKQWDYTSMNGNIVFYYSKKEGEEYSYKLYCSNNSTILKDTEWFKANRTWNGVQDG
ncbi:MAG: MBL fold metallo-hydrolase, partial [Clostridiales bacterium]|nr:MBL fold metallo-hydrolase [Clostridiales bacterium]